jgi:hypothetical protein
MWGAGVCGCGESEVTHLAHDAGEAEREFGDGLAPSARSGSVPGFEGEGDAALHRAVEQHGTGAELAVEEHLHMCASS